jgi:hypothetical protein
VNAPGAVDDAATTGAAASSRAAAAAPPPDSTHMLRVAWRRCAIALVLLMAAGLRHHLLWGNSHALGFRLRPWLDGAETACLFAFAWFGARGWVGAVAAVRVRSPGPRALLLATLPLLALAVAVPAFLSADVADYVMRGRVLALHGGNPYVDLATAYGHDPFVAFGDAAWKQFPLPYGPLVADLQGAVAWLGAQATFLPPRAQFVATVALFKLGFAACLLASAWLARGLYARLRGGSGDDAFVAVAWCPLLLNEAVAQAHNESLLLVTLLLSLHLTAVGRVGAGAFLVGVSTLTKLVPVLVAPLHLVAAVRTRRTGACVLGGITAAALGAWFAWRYFAEPGSLGFLARQSEVTSGSLVRIASRVLAIDMATALLCGRLVVVTVLGVACVRLWRQPTLARLVAGCAAVLAAMACCGLAGVGPWYHVWWVPIALLGSSGFLHRFAVAVVCLAPLAYVRWTSARAFDELHDAIALAMGTCVPALIALLVRRPQRAAVVSRE